MSGRLPDHTVDLPVNYQNWEHLSFLHWAYEPGVIQARLPAGLTVQEWDGAAWVGVTPFRMANVRLPGLPPPARLGRFPRTQRTHLRAVPAR